MRPLLTPGPRAERSTDLPLVTERIDDPSEARAVLARDRRRLRRRARPGGLRVHLVGVVDDQQRAARGAAGGQRAEGLLVVASVAT